MFAKPVAAILACCCTAAIFACIPAVQDDEESNGGVASAEGYAPSSGTPVASSREIDGKWDIVRFDGYEPARLSGATRVAFADFTERGVALKIECNSSGATGTVVDGTFKPQPGDRIQTLMGCGPEREARDAALFGFFDKSPSVRRLPDGKLLLSAEGEELVLQRPDQRRLDFLPLPGDLTGEWRLIGVTRYLEGNGYAGIGLSDVPGRIVFSDGQAGYTRCPQYDFGYRYTEEGRLLKISGPPAPELPEASCAELSEPRPGSIDMPVQWDVMSVLHASPLVEWAGDREILLSNDNIGLVLSRAQCGSREQSDDHSKTREVDCA
ncbi:META domain-containing protein [Qipengyuania qiaonensis]|uniref:META domain-containing protein n=1 Tax=Qipengyuania qiaonensis TaxID=2867240 RepID=A0ABS7J260_9SPHN|nr:META domain-containing protein [Qipengyuania qiaonensis]MBX7481415.1 META domain-containing protein [Qipengyuania qiaonensis]